MARRRCRLVLSQRRGIYVPSDLRQALARVWARRSAALAVGGFVPDRRELEAVFRKGRAKGLTSKRRFVTVEVSLDPGLVEGGLWFSGARSINELVSFALTRMILSEDPPRPAAVRLAARRPARKRGSGRSRKA